MSNNWQDSSDIPYKIGQLSAINDCWQSYGEFAYKSEKCSAVFLSSKTETKREKQRDLEKNRAFARENRVYIKKIRKNLLTFTFISCIIILALQTVMAFFREARGSASDRCQRFCLLFPYSLSVLKIFYRRKILCQLH